MTNIENIERAKRIAKALAICEATKEALDKSLNDLELAEGTFIDRRERVEIIKDDYVRSLDDLNLLLNDTNREPST